MPATAYKVPGPLSITWNSQDLGATKVGCIIRPRTSWSPITDDDHGSEPADFILSGKSCIVEIIGLSVSDLLNADLWGQNNMGLLSSDATPLGDIGTLASANGKILDITERDGSSHWTANITVPIDPDPITLNSTTELQIPLTFLIVPDANEKLFVTVPAYLYTVS